MDAMDLPCENCAQPEHCTGVWPEDGNFRPGQVRGCFGQKSRTVSVRSEVTAAFIEKDRTLSRDLAAYKRLRQDGVQPTQIDGSAEAENLGHRHVIEGTPDPKVVERVVDASGNRALAKGTELENAS